MARQKTTFTPPPWFDLAKYAYAEKMDAADWYINLLLRGHLWRGDDDGQLSDYLREVPLIRRGHDSAMMLQFRLMKRFDVDPDVQRILNGDEPVSSVKSLRTDELYFFEKRLPEPIREFGRIYEPGKFDREEAPSGFFNSLDRTFPVPMLGVFARIDLGKADDEIVADMRDFIAEKRREFAKLPIRQPHREALRIFGKHNAANMKTFAARAVLPYMDIQRWLNETGSVITSAALARLLEIDPDTLRETKKNCTELLDNMVMRGWLTAPAREAVRKEQRNS